jgi:hypothetical protein
MVGVGKGPYSDSSQDNKEAQCLTTGNGSPKKIIVKRYNRCCVFDELGRKRSMEGVRNIGKKHESVSSGAVNKQKVGI